MGANWAHGASAEWKYGVLDAVGWLKSGYVKASWLKAWSKMSAVGSGEAVMLVLKSCGSIPVPVVRVVVESAMLLSSQEALNSVIRS